MLATLARLRVALLLLAALIRFRVLTLLLLAALTRLRILTLLLALLARLLVVLVHHISPENFGVGNGIAPVPVGITFMWRDCSGARHIFATLRYA
jgi:hypothetical protein